MPVYRAPRGGRARSLAVGAALWGLATSAQAAPAVPEPAPAAEATNRNDGGSNDAAGRYTLQVRAPQRVESERVLVQGNEVRTAPGTLGDPFRVVALLPGVATMVPGLPLFAVRGASPGTSGFFLDGMRLPQLYHLLIGGGVVHGELIDQIDFFPSGYDVTYGRFAGGIVSATTRPAREEGQHLELGLRLYDASALMELSLPKGVRLTVSGHYGYPGPILNAIDERINLSYWDYQLRLDWRGLTVQALGAADALDVRTDPDTDTTSAQNTRLSFHRLQVRQRLGHGVARGELAIYGGYDEAGDVSGRGVHKLSAGARAQLHLRGRFLRLFAGIDGEVAQFSAERFDIGLRSLEFVRDAEGPARTSGKIPEMTPDELGDLGRSRVGMTAGAALQASADFLDRKLTLTVGTRLDVYHSDGKTLIGVDPRAQLTARLLPWLSMHLGGGVYQQPPTFPLLLPGIDTFALQLGLQRATGFSLTEEAKLPADLSLTASTFYQRFNNFTDLPPLGARQCAPPPPASLSGAAATLVRLTDGQAYGLEAMLRRQKGRVTGWISYTLSRSERLFPCGMRPADYDQTHVLNIVAQARLPRGFMIGARLYVATGRPETLVNRAPTNITDLLRDGGSDYSDVLGVRNNIRMPTFVQLDVRLDKHWQFRKFYLAAFLEVVNSTFSRSNLYLSYPTTDVPQMEPQLVGFNWILPSIGLRGGF